MILLILIVAVLTWILPAGQYSYLPDGAPIAGSYTQVSRSGQSIWAVTRAPLEGFYEAIEVAVFILMVGGFLGVMGKTGAVDAGIAAIVGRLGSRGGILIPILMCAFALGGTTFGMAEETIAFYPLLLPVMIAAGYDTVTAVSPSFSANTAAARSATTSRPAGATASPYGESMRFISASARCCAVSNRSATARDIVIRSLPMYSRRKTACLR